MVMRYVLLALAISLAGCDDEGRLRDSVSQDEDEEQDGAADQDDAVSQAEDEDEEQDGAADQDDADQDEAEDEEG